MKIEKNLNEGSQTGVTLVIFAQKRKNCDRFLVSQFVLSYVK